MPGFVLLIVNDSAAHSSIDDAAVVFPAGNRAGNQYDACPCPLRREDRDQLNKSVKELSERIERFIERHNETPVPFEWTATADSILEKLSRLSKHICRT